MRNNLLYTILILIGLSSCDEEQTSDERIVDDLPIFENPLIQNDDFFDGSHWNDPSVLMIDDNFVMYASSDIAWNGVVKIYRLTSEDGIDWNLNPSNPVFENSNDGAWDSHSVETPSVVFYDEQYHMFYTGYDVANDFTSAGVDNLLGTIDDDNYSKHFKIGHATSTDGINFTRQGIVAEPSAPYDAVNLDFNQFIVAEPAAIVKNNKLHLYFTALGADAEVNSTWQVIGLTIYDGGNWDSPRAVLKPDLDLYPRETYLGYSTPAAIEIEDQIHLYYDVVLESPWTQVKLHHASSVDGIAQWTQDATTLMSKEDYSWTAAEMRSPSPLVYNEQLYLYFAGHVISPDINLAIGLKAFQIP